MSKDSFVPCLFGEGSFLETKPGALLTNRQLRWWDREQGLFFYSRILLNAFEFGVQKKRPRIREELEIGKDVTVLVDSGGFQVWRQNANVPALEVFRFMEDNADRAFILDVPGEAKDPDEVFKKKIERTVDNCRIFEQNRTRSDLIIYRVLHGHSLDRLKMWYEALEPFSSFSGYSCASHPTSDMWGQARLAMFLYHMGHKGKLHFLGTSGRHVIPVLLWCSRYFEDVIFDSTSYAVGVRNREYELPNDLFQGSGSSLILGDRLQEWQELVELPCSCPVCTELQTIENMRKDPTGGMWASLHNLWLTQDLVRKLEKLLPYKELFLRYVEVNCKKETMLTIQFIEECVNGAGYDQAVLEYHRFMKLAVPSQEQEANFATMFTPVKKVRLKEPVRVMVPEDPDKPKRKKKSKGPVTVQKPTQRTILDLSGHEVTKLEEQKDERPGCYGHCEGEVCRGSDFCPEDYEQCRKSSSVSSNGS